MGYCRNCAATTVGDLEFCRCCAFIYKTWEYKVYESWDKGTDRMKNEYETRMHPYQATVKFARRLRLGGEIKEAKEVEKTAKEKYNEYNPKDFLD